MALAYRCGIGLVTIYNFSMVTSLLIFNPKPNHAGITKPNHVDITTWNPYIIKSGLSSLEQKAREKPTVFKLKPFFFMNSWNTRGLYLNPKKSQG